MSKPPKPAVGTASGTDVGLEVTATVFRTLQAVAGACPIPGLVQIANLALLITTTVQRVRGNKGGYEALAGDARELVYVIYSAYRELERAEDMPPGLSEKLDRVYEVLQDVQECAKRGAGRNRISAMFRSGADAGEIADARQQMQQCLTLFGFAADINLQVEVHKLAVQQNKMMEKLEEANKGGGGAESRPGPGPGPVLRGGSNSVVTNNHDSGNVYIGSHVNKDNTYTHTTSNNQDYSVHLGQGVNFAGASGINFGSDNVNNMNRVA
ncbi:hypothetical protein APHAL10511_000255 [Amanita phalloides]|nr:hypothetical protein APHAL10511_000255 [Amanita phalloides]